MDAQNAGNDISGFKISPRPPRFMRGILATHVAFSHCYPPLIYYLTERSLFKKCPPPHGKILKKGPAVNYQADTNASIIEINTIAENIDRTDMSNVENKDDRLKEIRKQKGCSNGIDQLFIGLIQETL